MNLIRTGRPGLAFAFLASAAALGLSLSLSTARADTLPVQSAVVIQPAASSVSRAEVQADFLVWRAAGMLNWQFDGADTTSAAYQEDLANYKAVRSSPQFALIQRAVEQGQLPRVAVQEHPLRVTIATR